MLIGDRALCWRAGSYVGVRDEYTRHRKCRATSRQDIKWTVKRIPRALSRTHATIRADIFRRLRADVFLFLSYIYINKPFNQLISLTTRKLNSCCNAFRNMYYHRRCAVSILGAISWKRTSRGEKKARESILRSGSKSASESTIMIRNRKLFSRARYKSSRS